MKLKKLTKKLKSRLDWYAERNNFEFNRDYYLIKLQEELGELASAYLKLTARGRVKSKSQDELMVNFKEELADVAAMTLLMAQAEGVDLEAEIIRKWRLEDSDLEG